jgi:anti-sigma factor RsiW
MNLPKPPIENECPRAELAAYIDGELLPREEIELERHLAGCGVCKFELNEQKRLLFALDFALEDEKDFELPANFAKVVVGKRRKQSERFALSAGKK